MDGIIVLSTGTSKILIISTLGDPKEYDLIPAFLCFS